MIFPRHLRKKKKRIRKQRRNERDTSALADTLFSGCVNRALLLPGHMKKAVKCRTARGYGTVLRRIMFHTARTSGSTHCMVKGLLYCQYHNMVQTNNQCTIYRFHGQNVYRLDNRTKIEPFFRVNTAVVCMTFRRLSGAGAPFRRKTCMYQVKSGGNMYLSFFSRNQNLRAFVH